MVDILNKYNFMELSIYTIVIPLLLWILKNELNNLYNLLRKKIIYLTTKKFNTLAERKIKTNLIVNELNTFFKDEVHFFSILDNIEPSILICDEEYNNESISINELRKEDAVIKNEGKVNEPHLLLKKTSDLTLDQITFQAEKTYFSTIRALRKRNKKPKIISAGAVIINPKEKELYIHLRSEKSDTYPSHYHILGGGFLPPSSKLSTTYDHKLSDTVLREINEETESKVKVIDVDQPRFRAFSQELDTGYIQYELLGLIVEKKEILQGNWEGDLVAIKFAKLEESLRSIEWVPSGKAHILAWLALGAPDSQYFKYTEARRIYESILGNKKMSAE